MESRHKKLFIDDYNESIDVNAMIHRLAENDSPIYVSCLSRPDLFEREIQKSGAYIGLHLYLTDYPVHCLNANKLNFKEEFYRQFDNFCEKMGKKPDYIDGHRHIQEYLPIGSCIKKLCREYSIPLRRNHPSSGAMKALATKRYWRSYFKNMMFQIMAEKKNVGVFNGLVASNYSFQEKDAFAMLLKRFSTNELNESFILHPGPSGWKRHEYEVFCSLKKNGARHF